ncbi:DUF2958 domain-containing protein [Pelagibacterium lacus]|uniref:DUF2958 domain-containing protein n=1 Tax=Pelagibacterium lacus TaxID=2282655 RepID=A0A369W2M3_9HYPH|nr:DUF2958 domain-containing protein [Pelagibacterium lacus]RDE07610.1 DUF2958 domain-containing protein [Pelagibacterium lacus]
MILLTDAQRAQLLANGRQRDVDHIPVVKLFNPLGEEVLLGTELEADGDTLYGLVDLGEPSPSRQVRNLLNPPRPCHPSCHAAIRRAILCRRMAACIGTSRTMYRHAMAPAGVWLC